MNWGAHIANILVKALMLCPVTICRFNKNLKAGHGSSNDVFRKKISKTCLPFSNTFVCLLSIKFTFITITYL